MHIFTLSFLFPFPLSLLSLVSLTQTHTQRPLSTGQMKNVLSLNSSCFLTRRVAGLFDPARERERGLDVVRDFVAEM
eukprot:m.139016 g.139016  ORF g.139016 m.139016 type:complete len:77 (-) comp24056_c0_seq3:287-517(-)